MQQTLEKEEVDTNNKNDAYYLSLTLNNLMKDADIKESELCKILNIPKSTLNYLTNTKSNPRVSTLVPIAKYFGISLDQLLGIVPLSNLLSKNVISETRNKGWLPSLYMNCTKLVCKSISDKNIDLSPVRIMEIIKEVYFYSVKKERVDQDFIEWFIEKEVISLSL